MQPPEDGGRIRGIIYKPKKAEDCQEPPEAGRGAYGGFSLWDFSLSLSQSSPKEPSLVAP